MRLRTLLPWQARIAAKLVLSRLPSGYAFWHRLNLFSHGLMDRPDYAYGVFRTHFDRSNFPGKARGFVGLELGPGDSALSAVIAAAHGARRLHLVDAGHFATEDLTPYRQMATQLRSKGLPAPDINQVESLGALLAACRADYGTAGLASLQAIEAASVDFVWSHAVLEHVRRQEFLPTMQAIHRLLKPGGVASHRVDLKDHLGGGLNNLRLGSHLWEQDWMARSGFYTNRLRLSEMLAAFRVAGFEVQLLDATRWDRSPIQRSSLAPEFQGLSDDDLRVSAFDVLLIRGP